jgi:hypothetical protein
MNNVIVKVIILFLPVGIILSIVARRQLGYAGKPMVVWFKNAKLMEASAGLEKPHGY